MSRPPSLSVADGPVKFGRYLLRRRIASGGMGEVFVAEQTGVGDFRKPLALKVMLPGLADDPKHVRLFLGEARVAARLTHPNIVPVYDAGCVDERYFLTMELVDGVSLSSVVKALRAAGGRLDAETLCHLARETLEGLRYAHELCDDLGVPLELIHRDISLGNILISRRGEVKLTDFGVAKMRGNNNDTAPGEVRGKLEYLAPEVLQGASATVRSDLYALGVTMYRVAALSSPFSMSEDLSPAALLLRHELIPLGHRRPDLPADFLAAVERAIATKPAARFSSATAMMEAFPRGDYEARRQELVAVVRQALGESPVAPEAKASFVTLSQTESIEELAPVAAPEAEVTRIEPRPRQVFDNRPTVLVRAPDHRPPGASLPTLGTLTPATLTPATLTPATLTPATLTPATPRRLTPAAAVAVGLGLGVLLLAGTLWLWTGPPSETLAPPSPSASHPASTGSPAKARDGDVAAAPGFAPAPAKEAPAPAMEAQAPAKEAQAMPERAASPPGAPRPALRAPLTASVRKVVKAPPPSPASAPLASLSVQAEPWAQVEVNGRQVGETPLGHFPIPSGTVVIRLSSPGHIAVERRLKVSPGEDVKVRETLVPR